MKKEIQPVKYDKLIQRRAVNKSHPGRTTLRMQEYNAIKQIQETGNSLAKLGHLLLEKRPNLATTLPHHIQTVHAFIKVFEHWRGNAVVEPLPILKNVDTAVPPDEVARREAEFERLYGNKTTQAPTPQPETAPIVRQPNKIGDDFDPDEVLNELMKTLVKPSVKPYDRTPRVEDTRSLREQWADVMDGKGTVKDSPLDMTGAADMVGMTPGERKASRHWDMEHAKAVRAWEDAGEPHYPDGNAIDVITTPDYRDIPGVIYRRTPKS